LKEELDSNPAWAATLTGFKDSQEKLGRKDRELVFGRYYFVASNFTKRPSKIQENWRKPKVIPLWISRGRKQ
jgi:hypothetical protein